MSSAAEQVVNSPNGSSATPSSFSQGRRPKVGSSLLARGVPMIWTNGGALVIALVMIIGLLSLVLYNGMSTFWPVPIVEIRTVNGQTYLGEVIREDTYVPAPSVFDSLPPEAREKARASVEQQGGKSKRYLIRTGNFEFTQTHHRWVSDFEIAEETRPEWALIVERATNDGRFYGFPNAFMLDDKVVVSEPDQIWAKFNEFHDSVRERVRQRERIKNHDIDAVSRKEESARVAVRQAEIDYGADSPQHAAAIQNAQEVGRSAAEEHARLNEQLAALNKENNRCQLQLRTADGKEKVLPLADIVRAYPANRVGFGEKLSLYFSRWWEFLTDEPRNANSEGGVFPAIWGTVAMTLLMSFLVVPFGVLAALYMKEYAKAGPVISAVRIAVNNLAGVPSIVFGVFGLGFFCYIFGGTIDSTFFQARLPSPTYGTGGLMWASLTLALLTLPVVIVATEEALAAVPRSMREGSYACGASKWQTIRRIVLPRAMPGILTGMILAMARGAGEVAPLMLVGAVKLAPALPVDHVFPFVHPQRSFMHLGFHIFDVGFQSPDSESAKPMVFTTTLLLIALVALLNVAAMWIRSRLRRKYVSGQF
jgi:phosphate transport system permease protein